MTDKRDERYALAWSEALRSIQQQQALLESIRSRTATLISAAAISTSFLGGVAFDDRRVGPPGLVAVVLFAVASGLYVWILLPRPGWKWVNTPQQLMDKYVEAENPCSIDEMHRDLALHLGKNHEENRNKLTWLMAQYSVASIFLAAEIVAWLVEL